MAEKMSFITSTPGGSFRRQWNRVFRRRQKRQQFRRLPRPGVKQCKNFSFFDEETKEASVCPSQSFRGTIISVGKASSFPFWVLVRNNRLGWKKFVRDKCFSLFGLFVTDGASKWAEMFPVLAIFLQAKLIFVSKAWYPCWQTSASLSKKLVTRQGLKSYYASASVMKKNEFIS
jgi:hypothetical protein